MNQRLYAKRGSELPWSKLTEFQVGEIRRLHAYKQAEIDRLNARFSAEAMAETFNVHVRTIEKILSHETWPHVRV